MPIYQLLVRAKDKVNPDDEVKHAQLTKRGDVIAVKLDKDAWWTKEEQTSPEWTILKADITDEAADALLTPELPPDLSKEYKMLRKRALKLDLDALRVFQPDKKRTDKEEVHPKEVIEAAISVKERLIEPDHLEVAASEAFAEFAEKK